MDNETYLAKALETEAGDMEAITKRLADPQIIRLLHCLVGMSTEANEALSMLKAYIFYGRELDLVNLVEEFGDSNWFQAIGIDVLRWLGVKISREIIDEKNIKKLHRGRFKEAIFTEEAANNRDLERERELLEDKQ
jgi:hypothetical protein